MSFVDKFILCRNGVEAHHEICFEFIVYILKRSNEANMFHCTKQNCVGFYTVLVFCIQMTRDAV